MITFLTLFGRWHYAEFALPLRCNRVAVTVQSRCRYGVIALPLRCNGDAIWLLWQQNLVKKTPAVPKRGSLRQFFRSICTGFQVLNFGNNILQFGVGALANSRIGPFGLRTTPNHPYPHPAKHTVKILGLK